MSYTKVTVDITPYTIEASDILIALFGDAGFESFEENATGFDGYIQTNMFNSSLVDDIEIPIDGVSFKYTSEEIPDQNWNEEWEKNYFQPIIIGNQCVVRGPFHPEFPETPYQITINPKMAFGTGHHETTGLMIRHILESKLENLRILDMGCGTGILGILASMRGATEVVGIDIDQWSYDNTIENCQLNRINNMHVECGDAGLLQNHSQFDCILANINRNILLEDIKEYEKVLKLNGMLFLSGFYTEDLELINNEAKKYHLRYLSHKVENNWVAASYIKTLD